ncbi:hypothetical protein SAMN06298212_1337 [Ruaniaceae bacterium KH17]|nr:hypothetical protein SAMN06298212_1337 [Ruaniaceae bacterium KH17]
MTETPSPTPNLELPWVVSPGIEGFAMFLLLAVVTILLIRSMLTHVRKANFRAAEREAELYGESAAADLPDGDQPSSEADPTSD